MDPELKLLFFYLLLRKSLGVATPALVANWRDQKFSLEAVGLPGARLYETGAANIFCNKVEFNARQVRLVMIGAPNEWEKGLLVANQVHTVYYLGAGNQVYHVDLSAALSDGTFPAATLVGALGTVADKRDPQWSGWRSWFVGQKSSIRRAAAHRLFDEFISSFTGLKTYSSDPLKTGTLPFFDGLPVHPSPCTVEDHRDGILMKLAFALVGVSWSSRTPRENLRAGTLPGGNNIGAVLTDKNCRIIGWSVNVAGDGNGPTCHAECALVRAFINKQGMVPAGCRLYTTLEPCYMCAGLLATYCPSWKVLYGQSDATIKNNALKRKANNSSQEQINATSAASVEKLYVDGGWRAGQTLKFLRDENSRKAFGKLALVPKTLLDRMTDLNTARTISARPDSTTVFGRLGLDIPATGRQAVISAGHAHDLIRASRRLDGLDLAVRPAPSVAHRTTYTTAGGTLDQEVALIGNCVSLLGNLLTKGYVRTEPSAVV